MENLEKVIEAVLFALGRYISFDELSSTLKVDKEEVKEALKKIEKRYNSDEAIELVYIRNGVQLVTNHKYYNYVSLFVENTKKESLSPAALETLTIIAYNPKITKSDIEKIRGVNSDFAVSRLLECGLIEEVARLNLPGRPAVYSVTDEFLKSTNISSVEELPEFGKIRVQDEQMMINEIEKEGK